MACNFGNLIDIDKKGMYRAVPHPRAETPCEVPPQRSAFFFRLPVYKRVGISRDSILKDREICHLAVYKGI